MQKHTGSANTVLELDNVWKIYSMDQIQVMALRGISMKINQGEFVAVMGASGSGKSTALNMMGVLDIPSKGKIFLDGIDITGLSDSKLARLRGSKIGFVFQAFNLHPTLSVFENIALPMRIHELPKERVEKIVPKLIELVGLGHRNMHLPAQLSGGEKQRVAIARALSTEPSMILADEPTGNLDSTTSMDIMHLLLDLHKKGKTVVIVTHERDIAAYAQRVITLKDGAIISDKKQKEMVK